MVRPVSMIPFSKYEGAGNDFVLVAGPDLPGDPAALARRLCPRSTGVGVDGLALVEREGDGVLSVRFFNPDGSEFATCGNGTRCVARWAVDRDLDRQGTLEIRTADGPVTARVRGDEVSLLYRLSARIEGERRVRWGQEARAGWLVFLGTPHLVLVVDEMPGQPFETLCRPVRRDPALGPEGANVNVVHLTGEGRARIRTFERGVEAETLACGAGCMSAALTLHAAGLCGPTLVLETRRGDRLRVELPEGPAKGEERLPLRLTGPARRVFEGTYPLEDRPVEG